LEVVDPRFGALGFLNKWHWSTLRSYDGLWTWAYYQACILTATASRGPMMMGSIDFMGDPSGANLSQPD
jgi:hypothetical protein